MSGLMTPSYFLVNTYIDSGPEPSPIQHPTHPSVSSEGPSLLRSRSGNFYSVSVTSLFPSILPESPSLSYLGHAFRLTRLTRTVTHVIYVL